MKSCLWIQDFLDIFRTSWRILPQTKHLCPATRSRLSYPATCCNVSTEYQHLTDSRSRLATGSDSSSRWQAMASFVDSPYLDESISVLTVVLLPKSCSEVLIYTPSEVLFVTSLSLTSVNPPFTGLNLSDHRPY